MLAVVGEGDVAEAFFAPLAGSGVRTVAVTPGARAYRREREIIRQRIREIAPDVVNSHGYRADLMHGGPTRRAGVATVSTVHGSSRMGGLSHLLEWLQLRALRRFDAVVPVSRPLQATLRRVGVAEACLHLIPNAVISDSAMMDASGARGKLGLPPTGAVLGFVGRIVEVKGLDILLRALARTPAESSIASIIGDGPARPAMERLAAELGLGDRVRFHGEIGDAGALLPAFDVLVLPSRSEGTPIVILEAMRAALPVVATAVGGVPDVVSEDTGWLVPTEDPAALAAAIMGAVADRAEARRRGQAGLARLRAEYDAGTWVERYDAVYESAIAMRKRG